MGAQRCHELRLTGSGGANRVMEAELKRLVVRAPFPVRVEKPKREGEETLLYPFDAGAAWVAACHHRTSSRISWDLWSSAAVRLEPLVDPMGGSATIPIEGAGLAVGAAIRRPSDLPLRHLAAFKDLPHETPDLFPGTVAQIVALDVDQACISAMVGNLRAAGLTGP